jgi:hypothetical protein
MQMGTVCHDGFREGMDMRAHVCAHHLYGCKKTCPHTQTETQTQYTSQYNTYTQKTCTCTCMHVDTCRNPHTYRQKYQRLEYKGHWQCFMAYTTAQCWVEKAVHCQINMNRGPFSNEDNTRDSHVQCWTMHCNCKDKNKSDLIPSTSNGHLG